MPLRFLLATFAGWVNRQQTQAIHYLVEENRVLRKQLGERRPRLSDNQRRRLAVKGQALGRKLLSQVAAIVTPDTILRWHRRLIATKHTYPHRRRTGRPGIMKAIRELIVQMATDNSSWGYPADPGRAEEGRTPRCPHYDRQDAEGCRRAAQPRAPDFVAHIPEVARRRDRRHRLLHGRRVDGARAGHALRAVRHSPRHQDGRDRRHHDEPERGIHGAGCAQPDRLGRRSPRRHQPGRCPPFTRST